MKRIRTLMVGVFAAALVCTAAPAQAAPNVETRINAHYLQIEKLQEQLFLSTSEKEFEAVSGRIQTVLAQLEAIPEYRHARDKAEQDLQDAFTAKALADREALGFELDGAAASGEFDAMSTVSWSQVQKGDVLHINNKKFFNLYAMYYSHSGISDGSGWIYESITDGVYRNSDSEWRGSGNPVALGRTNGKTASERSAAVEWAKTTYGTDGTTPYNWNFANKSTDSSLYCSQLVWKIHQHMGLDVDSNHWTYIAWMTARHGAAGGTLAYAMVAPDEIYLSSHINYYSTGNG